MSKGLDPDATVLLMTRTYQNKMSKNPVLVPSTSALEYKHIQQHDCGVFLGVKLQCTARGSSFKL